MSTVTIGVSSLEEVMRRTAAAFRGKRQGERISFASVELLWKTLTPRRWGLIRAMAGQGPMSMRAAARLVGHDVKTIHGDVRALLDAEVLEKDEMGRIVFPYDVVHVDFTITKVAS
ncbi:MAG TPA: transcriptional regulator [Acetobacteraceae bacterium]|nr:transcriptional regulator [Acetobacteraceae bacterium]